MDQDDLDDTYDLLSPVRKSYEYSDSFVSSDEEAGSREISQSFSFSKSSSLPPPKYASTTRYQSESEKMCQNVNTIPTQPRKHPIRKISSIKTHDDTKELMKIPQEDDTDVSVTVWEHWLIKKMKDEREKLKIQIQVEEEARQEEVRLKREKIDRKKKTEIKIQQWYDEKVLKLKLQKTIEKREKLLKEELKAQEKEEVNKKSKAAYRKWLEKQEQQEKEQKEKERQRKEKEEAEREEKRRKNEESFQRWLQNVNGREATSPRLKSARLREYPPPSYTNPTQWVGPMEDEDTKDSVCQQHKLMIAKQHAAIKRNQQRPQSATQLRKGLVKTGPGKDRPSTCAPV